jgi:hypothetical protein
MEMHTWAFKYIRTFEMLQKSARIDFTQAYQEGRWSGLLNGAPASITRSGLSDSVLRFAINLYGATPLEGKEFAAYRAKLDVETIFGAALVVHLPTGDYMNDKLINLSTNRFTFRPGLWASAGAGYGYGRKSTLSGVDKNDRRENLGWVLSFGFPITRQLGVKFAYRAIRAQESIGQDSNDIGAAFSIFW